MGLEPTHVLDLGDVFRSSESGPLVAFAFKVDSKQIVKKVSTLLIDEGNDDKA